MTKQNVLIIFRVKTLVILSDQRLLYRVHSDYRKGASFVYAESCFMRNDCVGNFTGWLISTCQMIFDNQGRLHPVRIKDP